MKVLSKLISDKKNDIGGKMCNFATEFNNRAITNKQHEDEKDNDWNGCRHLSADDQLW